MIKRDLFGKLIQIQATIIFAEDNHLRIAVVDYISDQYVYARTSDDAVHKLGQEDDIFLYKRPLKKHIGKEFVVGLVNQRFCHRDDCGKVFTTSRKDKKFCSGTCAAVTRTRRRRAREAKDASTQIR